jgi:uncharacterized protein YkwD
MNSTHLIKYSLYIFMLSMLVACGSSGESDINDSSGFSSVISVSSSQTQSSPQTQNSSTMSSVASSVISTSSITASSLNQNVSSTSNSAPALAAPQNITAVPANGSVTLSWNPVSGASSYTIYYASEADILIANIASFDDGTVIQNSSSPRVINSLRNDETYYFVVTAVNANGESLASTEVSATPTAIDLTKQPTAQEVLVVELINRARANPEAEATRYAIGLNDGITGGTITSTPKPPLAHNLFLIDSARAHSQWMLDTDTFSHTGANGSTATQRMTAAGYLFTGTWENGENIAWGGTRSSSINLTNYALSHHEGLFKSPGHRVNILNAGYREIGVGQKQGNFTSSGTTYLASMLTQNFARSGTQYFITGVAYNDANNNDFYDVGEALSGITISLNGKTYSVYNTGAFSIPVANGTYDLTIAGDILGTALYSSVQINNANVKVDIVKTADTLEVITP